MPVRLGEIGSLIRRQNTPGSGDAMLSQGIGAIRQRSRDEEDDRRAGVREGQEDRRQTEAERATGAREAFGTRKQDESQDQLDLSNKMAALGKMKEAALAGDFSAEAMYGAMVGIDAKKHTPEEFRKEATRIEEEVSKQVEEAAAMQEAALAENEAQLGELVEGVYGEGGDGAEGRQAVRGLDQNLDSYIDLMAADALSPQAANMAMGMLPQQPQQAPPPPAQPQMQAPPQQAPQMQQPGAAMAMGMMPQPQMQSPTAREWTMDVGGRQVSGGTDPAGAAMRMEAQRVAQAGVAIDQMYDGLAEAATAAGQTASPETYRAVKDATKAFVAAGMTLEKANNEVLQGEGLKPMLERMAAGERAELAAAARRAAARRQGGKDVDAQYAIGEKMVEKQLKQFNFGDRLQGLTAVDDALRLLEDDNPSNDMAAIYSIATSREPGARLSTADVENVMGHKSVLQKIETMVKGAVEGGMGAIDRGVLIDSLQTSKLLQRRAITKTHGAAKRASEKAAKRGAQHGLGASDLLDTTFADFTFLNSTAPRRAVTEDDESKPTAELGGKYGY